jgi:transmembrane sensor
MKKGDKESLTFDKILLRPDYLDFIQSLKEGIEKDDFLKHKLDKASFISQILTSHKKIKYDDDLKKRQAGRLLARIKAEEKSKQNNKTLYFLRIAAAAMILVALSVFLLKRDLFMSSDTRDAQLELIVPSGEKSQLILADGTKVWINSESRLVYPVSFKDRDRRVMLEGEAYFDVSKVENSPFTVYTQDVKVKVLGTKFNIKSYPKDQTIETTVVEGLVRVEDEEEKVRFSPIVLKTAERMVFRKDEAKVQTNIAKPKVSDKIIQNELPVTVKEILISHVNTDNITCWKDHLLVFDNETLEEIALKMSRWYKVQVDILDTDLKTHRYTGKFVNNESLDQVLEAINLTTPIQYNINRNSVQIRPRIKK